VIDYGSARPGLAIMRAVVSAANRVRRSRNLASSIEATRPISSSELSERFLAELVPEEATRLLRYVQSAGFEQAAFNLVLQRFLVGGHRRKAEELWEAVRSEVRQGIRHFVMPAPDRLRYMTDLLMRELQSAVETPAANPSVIAGYGSLELAAVGYHASAAVRNSELLASLQSLAGFNDFMTGLRSQIAAVHGHMRLPHVKGSKSVPFDQLYVQPRFPSMRTIFDNPGTPWTADWTRIGQRTVVLGDPGAGKSTFAAKLAYDLVREDAYTLIPFLVVMRDFTERLRENSRGLKEYLEDRCRAPYHVEPPTGAVEYLLLNGEAAVILDGLDELTDTALRSRVVELIEGFVHRYPAVPVVVTSRRIGYDDVPLSGRLFSVVGL
jgi:hypothetical protein